MKTKKIKLPSFQAFASIVIISGILLLFMAYQLYIRLEGERRKMLTKESLRVYDSIRSTLDREIYGIAMGFTWWDKFLDAALKEDNPFFDAQTEDLLAGETWIGFVILKDGKIIYKSGICPHVNYSKFVSSASPLPHKVYTHKKDGKFYGFVAFSICNNKGKNCLNNAVMVVVFDWREIIKRYDSLLSAFYIELRKVPPSKYLTCIPLKDEEGISQGFLVFREKASIFEDYMRNFLLLDTLLIVILIAFILDYFLKRNELIERIGEELGWGRERKKRFSWMEIWSYHAKRGRLDDVIERILGVVAIHKTYRQTLEVAIKTKNLKETLRVLANSLKEEFSARYWSIVLTPEQIDQWRYLLWSENLEEECLREVLDLIKTQALDRIEKMRREKKVLFIESTAKEPTWIKASCLKPYRIVSSVHIPMIVHGKAIGFLALDWSKRKNFSEKEKVILREIKEFITGILESAYDIQDMFWLSYKDPLLGIYNRRIIDDLSKRKDINYVLFIDVDNFKQVNDIYGHAKGDEVLKSIVKIIQENIRSDDILIRYGGDEFVVCFRNGTKEKVQKIRERIKDAVKQNLSHLNVSVSVGMKEIDPEESLIEAIEKADMDMYLRKRTKRK